MMILDVLLLIYRIGCVLTCNGKAPAEPELSDEEGKWTTGMQDSQNKHIWGGWDPPNGAMNAWSHWQRIYDAEKEAGKGNYSLDGKTPYGTGVPGFPSDWSALGTPWTGMLPPPWAYVPMNFGMPAYCSLPPDYGNNCSLPGVNRWGYNPFQNHCKEFKWTGCTSNRNHFTQKSVCEKHCKNYPAAGCGPDGKVPIDYLTNDN